MHFCSNENCRCRISLGKSSDKDSVSLLCLRCKRLYSSSDERLKKVFLSLKRAALILFALVFFVLIFTHWDKIKGDTSIKNSIEKSNIINQNDSTEQTHKIDNDKSKDRPRNEKEIRNNVSSEKSSPNKNVSKKESNNSGSSESSSSEDPGKGKRFMCPLLEKNVGDSCNDGDETTFFDKVNASCECKGIRMPEQSADKDGDGVIDRLDCDDQNPKIGRVGDICDDNDPMTSEDRVSMDCICRGTKTMQAYYFDKDGDGLGVLENSKPYVIDQNPKGWVLDTGDNCPNRKGSVGGCPTLKIKSLKGDFFVGREYELEADESGLLPEDELHWSANSSINFINSKGRVARFIGETVGKYKVRYEIENPADPIKNPAIITLNVKISQAQIRDIIQPIVVQGTTTKPGNFEQRSQEAMRELFRHTVSKKINVYDENGLNRGPLDTFLTSDVKLGLPKNKINLKILDIYYENATGKISELHIQFL